MFESGGLEKICKNRELIYKIYSRRAIIQQYTSFSEAEQDKIDDLLFEGAALISKDSEDNIWLSLEAEEILDKFSGGKEHIGLGRINELLRHTTLQIGACSDPKKRSSYAITYIIKNFTHIISLFRENLLLIGKMSSSDYGGESEHIEKIEYLKYIQEQLGSLYEESRIVREYVQVTYKSNFLAIGNDTLQRKVLELVSTLRDVDSTLSSEIDNVKELMRYSEIKVVEDLFRKKLRIVDYLMEKGRFAAETNFAEVVAKIPDRVKIPVAFHLDMDYAFSDDYGGIILDLLQKEGQSATKKTVVRKEAKIEEVEEENISIDFIDAEEVYEAFLKQEKTLLEYIETIKFSNDEEDNVIDLFLDVSELYLNEPGSENEEFEMEQSKDKRFNVIKIKSAQSKRKQYEYSN